MQALTWHGREDVRLSQVADPVIAAPEAYGGGGWMISRLKGEKHPTAKRKRRFQSPDEMIERFRDRVPYRAFHPEALRDGREIHFPDHTHFLPMEIPERIAELILAEARAATDDSPQRPETPRAR